MYRNIPEEWVPYFISWNFVVGYKWKAHYCKPGVVVHADTGIAT